MRGVSQAEFGSLVARGVAAVSHDVDDLTSGFWVVVVTFEGHLTAVRMDEVHRLEEAAPADARRPPHVGGWPALTGSSSRFRMRSRCLTRSPFPTASRKRTAGALGCSCGSSAPS